MPITPDLPFPKSAGDAIRSKDWNDLVAETQRLDTAKVNRAGDAITGALTVAGALSVGTTASNAKLDVSGDMRINDNDIFLRVGVDKNHGLGWFGLGKLFAGANIDGPVLYGWSGGALGTLNGGQKAALRWNTSGDLRWANSTLRTDQGGCIELGGDSSTAGTGTPYIDFHYNGKLEDYNTRIINSADGRLEIMAPNGLSVSANMGVGVAPLSNVGLYVNGLGKAYGLFVYNAGTYGLYVSGEAYCSGRFQDQSLRSSVYSSNGINTTATSWVDMPNMTLSVTMPKGNYVQISVIINGVQATGGGNIGGYFRLLVDGTQYDLTRHEFNNNGWELRGVTLGRLMYLAAGSHTIKVQWYTTSGTLTCCWYGDGRQIQFVEL